jgi:hypothetical protein
MAELGEHFCSACGQPHGAEERTSPEVEIARINAERDVKIARMEYREAVEAGELAAETAIEVTELETAADVAVAEETDPPEPDSSEDGNQSIIVEGPPAEPEEEPSLEPKEEHLPEPTASKSRGYWG